MKKKMLYFVISLFMVLLPVFSYSADIRVRDMTELTAPDSTDIFYTEHVPAGTPAPRKITYPNMAKGLGWYDVRQNGAKCDGTTDDAVGLQAAITAAAGKILFWPPATCITGTALTRPSNTVWIGTPGVSTLKQKNGSNLAAIIKNDDQTNGNSNLYTSGLIFDGNGTNQTGGTGRAIDFQAGSGKIVSDITFEHFEIKNTYTTGTSESGEGIYFKRGKNITFRDFKITDTGGNGISGQGSIILIENFYIDQMNSPGWTTGGNWYGDAIAIGTLGLVNSDHVTIRKGYVTQSVANGVMMAVDIGLAEDLWLVSNGRKQEAQGLDAARSNGFTAIRIHATGNTGYGFASESQTPDDATMIQGQVTIEDSDFVSNTLGGIYILEGTGTIKLLTIKNNRVVSNGSGIVLSCNDANGILEALLEGNYCKDNSTGAGIGLTAVVYGKALNNWSFGSTPGAQGSGFYVQASNVHFGDNRVYNNTANYNYVGTNTVNWINGLNGQVTVDTTATTGAVTFTANAPQADASYYLTLVPVSSVGTPATGSNRIKSIAKLTTGFTVTVEAAPGGGNSVTFDWHLTR